MRVCVDGAAFENSHQLGIWRYAYEILRRAVGKVEVGLWLGSKPNRPIPNGVQLYCDVSRTRVERWDLLTRVRRRAARLRPPREVVSADIFHSTSFSPCPSACPVRIVTIYDMIPERLFHICDGWSVHQISRKRTAVQTAKLYICISHATARDFLSFYPQCSDRVRVIHLGADHLCSSDSISDTSTSTEPYVLFVGARKEYKNFRLILEAMQNSVWPKGLSMHVTGSLPAEHELAIISRFGLSDRVRFLGLLSDDQLQQQYRSAICFIFPSLLEGFGLPVLEAQANNCPVVLSEIPVFREVAGDAGVFFDPRLSERLAEAVAAVCEPSCSHRLRDAGLENVRRFSWDRTAEQTLALYEEAEALYPA